MLKMTPIETRLNHDLFSIGGVLKPQVSLFSSSVEQALPLPHEERRRSMKKLFALAVLCLSMSVPSFGAEHVVSHSAKLAGKESYKAAKFSAKEADKAGKAIVKFVF
jgi:hypothetical protein